MFRRRPWRASSLWPCACGILYPSADFAALGLIILRRRSNAATGRGIRWCIGRLSRERWRWWRCFQVGLFVLCLVLCLVRVLGRWKGVRTRGLNSCGAGTPRRFLLFYRFYAHSAEIEISLSGACLWAGLMSTANGERCSWSYGAKSGLVGLKWRLTDGK